MAITRTTAGLVGDLLASMPGHKLSSTQMVERLERDRSGINEAITVLSKAGAVMFEADPADRRRNAAYMTADQASAWLVDGGRTIANAAKINLDIASTMARAVAGTRVAAERRQQPLRFAMWSDGAIGIEGLTRKQLTLPADATAQLAQTLAALPEGALQALAESPLKPSFTLTVDGREYALDAAQASDLVAYVESLPARTIRAGAQAARLAGVQKPGTDHRVHRLETAADREHEDAGHA